MLPRKYRWLVSPLEEGWWWQDKRWTQTPDFKRRCCNIAWPKTKVGAWRIALKCPVRVEVVCQIRGTHTHPHGIERYWHLGGSK